MVQTIHIVVVKGIFHVIQKCSITEPTSQILTTISTSAFSTYTETSVATVFIAITSTSDTSVLVESFDYQQVQYQTSFLQV